MYQNNKKHQLDSELLEQFNQRNTSALEAVYRYFYTDLCLFANHLFSNTEINGSDIVHDIFIRIWQNQRIHFEHLINIKVYVYTSIKNRFKDYLSKNERERRYRNSVYTKDEYYEAQILEVESLSLVDEAMKLLPCDYAEIFRLYMDGWTIKEIADKLGKSQSTIYQKKQNAIEILKCNLHNLYLNILI